MGNCEVEREKKTVLWIGCLRKRSKWSQHVSFRWSSLGSGWSVGWSGVGLGGAEIA